MDKRILVGIIAAVVVVAGAFALLGTLSQTDPAGPVQQLSEEAPQTADAQEQAQAAQEEPATESPETAQEAVPEEASPASSEHVVEMSSSGFSPASLSINKGDTVTFVQKDSSGRWPASAFHPTHTVYPGSDIKKCGTGAVIFDSCKGLAEGESWSFTFNEAGIWKYHDHLQSSSFGEIVVQ